MRGWSPVGFLVDDDGWRAISFSCVSLRLLLCVMIRFPVRRRVPFRVFLGSLSGLALFFCVAASSFGRSIYRPTHTISVNQNWTWNEDEALPGQELQCMDFTENGILWAGTLDGVAYYDGRTVRSFGVSDGVEETVAISIFCASDGSVYLFQREAIYRYVDQRWRRIYSGTVNYQIMNLAAEGPDGRVWAASSEGIFEIRGDRVVLHPGFGEPMGTVCVDARNALWAVVLDNGRTYRIDLSEGALPRPEEWKLVFEASATMTSRYGFVVGENDTVWRFSTDPGENAIRYDIDRDEWDEYDFRSFDASNQVQGACLAMDGVLWVVADGILHGFVDQEWSAHQYLSTRYSPTRSHLAQSPDGALWLLEVGLGLHRNDYAEGRWKTLEGLLFQEEDSSGNLWFLSENDLVVQNEPDGNWWAFGPSDGTIEEPIAIAQIQGGALWVRGSHQGVAALAIFQDGKWERKLYPNFGDAFSSSPLVELNSGDVLMISSNYRPWNERPTAGLIRLGKNGELYPDSILPATVLPFNILGIAPKGGEGVWLHDLDSLMSWDGQNVEYLESPLGLQSFRNVNGIVDSHGRLWFAVWGRGIILFDGEGSWVEHGAESGLSSNFVSSVVERVDGAVFALTERGLDRFDGVRWQSVSDAMGLSGPRDSTALKRSRGGAVWINQANVRWFNRVNESEPYTPPTIEPFRTTRYQSRKGAPDTQLNIIHSPDRSDRSLSVRWSGLDEWAITSKKDLQFSYRLDGGKWSNFIDKPEHTFHQLDEGEHRIEVRSRDSDFNVDPTPASYEFTIPLPIWKETWFVLSVVLVVLLIATLLVVIVFQKLRHVLEYDRQRLGFFTNISHELRTPLSLILAPLEKAVRETEAESTKEDLTLALKSACRLNQLVDDLLDFRRIESGMSELRCSHGDIVAEVEGIVLSFVPLAETKSQELALRRIKGSKLVSYDKEKFQKVAMNLLSNALKYTPRDGRIEVSLEFHDDIGAPDGREWISLVVEDTGPGITFERQKHIFEPFYRADSKAALNATGTGLGLSLSQKLVSLMDGKIEVLSPVRENSPFPGTRFTFSMPIDPVEETEKAEAETQEAVTSGVADALSEENMDTMRSTVLLIEDNEEMRNFLGRELAKDYEVMSAQDGEAGLALAQEKIPDLVIVDVMMPVMNGFEFCRELKGGHATNHIPVIMLTARVSEKFERIGLESGADEYLSKPVSIDMLHLRIRNLLGTRAKVQERIRKQFLSEPRASGTAQTSEEKFIERVVQYLDANLSNATFGVDEMAEQLGLSRSSFYRKLKAVSDTTPVDFIRDYRIKWACKLIRESNLSVTEVMGRVGYTELSYFGKVFKSIVGSSPTDYRKRIVDSASHASDD